MIEKRRTYTLLDVLEMVFFALILNLNAVKVVTKINNSLMTYAVFILFAAVVIFNKIQNDGLDFHIDNTMLLMLSLFVIAAIVSMVWTGSDNFANLAKFVAGVAIAYLASQMKWRDRVGGLKIFRDLIWQMQGRMRADHRFYKEHGFYNFPQKNRGKMLAMYLVGTIINNRKMQRKLGGKLTDGMLGSCRKVLEQENRR